MIIIKLWVDDVRTPPEEDCVWCKTSDEAISKLKSCIWGFIPIEILDLDHDAGDEAIHGGDYIHILEWLEKEQIEFGHDFKFPIHIHSMNPVGVQNMRAIIQANGWREV